MRERHTKQPQEQTAIDPLAKELLEALHTASEISAETFEKLHQELDKLHDGAASVYYPRRLG